MENSKPRIRVGRAEMDFQHQGRTLTAVHPFYGPANSLALLKQIRGTKKKPTGLVEPTAPEVVSFVQEYFNGDGFQAQEVTRMMRGNYVRGFTGILCDPATQLVSFTERPTFNDSGVVDRDALVKRVATGDFYSQVPFEHAIEGEIYWNKVAKHRYLIAWVGGQEGVEKLAELVSRHPVKVAQLWVPSISSLTHPEARVAALYSDRDGRLSVSDVGYGDGEGGCAFGRLKTLGE